MSETTENKQWWRNPWVAGASTALAVLLVVGAAVGVGWALGSRTSSQSASEPDATPVETPPETTQTIEPGSDFSFIAASQRLHNSRVYRDALPATRRWVDQQLEVIGRMPLAEQERRFYDLEQQLAATWANEEARREQFLMELEGLQLLNP